MLADSTPVCPTHLATHKTFALADRDPLYDPAHPFSLDACKLHVQVADVVVRALDNDGTVQKMLTAVDPSVPSQFGDPSKAVAVPL